MAPNRGLKAANDFDPEASPDPIESDGESDASSGDEAHVNGAREHYIDVGKSELRHPRTPALGAQYRGSRMRREAMSEDDESDDPFAGEDGSGADEGEMSGDEEDARPLNSRMMRHMDSAGEKAQLASVAHEQPVLRSSLSQLRKKDVEKGRAVKRQHAAFDSLLGARIKLQKALVGVNTIAGISDDVPELERRDGEQDAIEKAEDAAFRLWSSLNDFRDELMAARTGEKRKRSPFTSDTATEELWAHMQAQEESTLPRRRAILQYWAKKTSQAKIQPQDSLITNTSSTLLSTLDSHLSNPEPMLKRAHTPRSCAPLQLAANTPSDPGIYDDADFYGLLLKELLERRSADSVAAANVGLDFHLQREAKPKKSVDVKASKGRKMRFTVHEKLQNFMAPEDRRRWGERQAEELFGSLFGRGMGLGDEDDERIDGMDEREEGLALFRS